MHNNKANNIYKGTKVKLMEFIIAMNKRKKTAVTYLRLQRIHFSKQGNKKHNDCHRFSFSRIQSKMDSAYCVPCLIDNTIK